MNPSSASLLRIPALLLYKDEIILLLHVLQLGLL
jgi:hypothetical protein